VPGKKGLVTGLRCMAPAAQGAWHLLRKFQRIYWYTRHLVWHRGQSPQPRRRACNSGGWLDGRIVTNRRVHRNRNDCAVAGDSPRSRRHLEHEVGRGEKTEPATVWRCTRSRCHAPLLLITRVFGRQAGCARQTRVWRGAVRDAHRYRGIDIPARLIASGAMHRRCFPGTMRPPRHPCHAERANCRHPNNALPRICCELPLQDGNTRVIRNPGFHPGLMELALQAGIAEGREGAKGREGATMGVKVPQWA